MISSILKHPNFIKYKPLLLFAVKAVSVYAILSFLFWGYVGLADPQGEYDLTGIFGSFNLILIITRILVIFSESMLNVLGYETLSGTETLSIVGSPGVIIKFACLGIKLWFAWIALIVAFPSQKDKKWLYRLLFIAGGILIIHLINATRVSAIVYRSFIDYGTTVKYHDYFNYAVYIFIFLGFYLYIRYFTREEKGE